MLFAIVAMFLFVGTGRAGYYYLHLDVDGVLDGSDDTLYVAPGDTIEIVTWITSNNCGFFNQCWLHTLSLDSRLDVR